MHLKLTNQDLASLRDALAHRIRAFDDVASNKQQHSSIIEHATAEHARLSKLQDKIMQEIDWRHWRHVVKS